MTSKEQGKKGRPEARPDRAAARRRGAMLGLGVLFVALFVAVAIAQGLGHPSPSGDEIAVVEEAPDGTITQEEFDAALEQTAARQGLNEVPPEDDPQYELLRDSAISDLLLARWVAGEASDRGIEVSEREIDEELEKIKQQQFGSQKAFDKFLEQSGFTPDDARERVELQLISDRVQQAVLPEEPPVAAEEIQTFYDENITQFQQPETRDVRVVLTKTEDEASEALAQLQKDSSAKGWEAVAKEFSIDEATKSTGGLRQAVVEGQNEPALDEQIFTAPTGELVGPFATDAGFQVIQVEKVTEARTTPLDEVSDQVRQTLVSARQQQIAQAFQEDFTDKWRSRTFCADGYRIDRCDNAEPLPDACTEEVATTQGCDAPVASRRPIAPGTAGVFGAPEPQGLPQGPIIPQPAVPAGGIPPGLTPLPGGAAPPGTPPPVPPPVPPPGG